MKRYVAILICLTLGWSPNGHPAWTLKPGTGQLIHSIYHYRAESYYDASGARTSQKGFTKWEYNPYLEYGWREGVTIGGSFRAQALQALTDKNGESDKEIGLSDIELFSRFRLWQNNKWVISLQPWIKIPGPYDKDDEPALGNGQFDSEMRLMVGRNFESWGRNHYMTLEVAYRARAENPSDEIRADSTIGYTLGPTWSFLMQSSHVFAQDDIEVGPLQVTNSQSYDLQKIQMSFVKDLENSKRFQVGVFKHLSGKNTGAGGGIMAAVWQSF